MTDSPEPDEPFTVNVVDDDKDMREALQSMLHDEGFTCACFDSPENFLAEYDQRPGCIILDLAMPGMNGLELHQTLSQRGWSLPFIMITGHGNVPTAVSAMRHGAIDFIEKPFSSAKLVASVREALATAARELGIRQRMDSLTPREAQIMAMLVKGQNVKQLSAELGISVKTGHVHRTRVLDKMHVSNVAELSYLLYGAAKEAHS